MVTYDQLRANLYPGLPERLNPATHLVASALALVQRGRETAAPASALQRVETRATNRLIPSLASRRRELFVKAACGRTPSDRAGPVGDVGQGQLGVDRQAFLLGVATQQIAVSGDDPVSRKGT